MVYKNQIVICKEISNDLFKLNGKPNKFCDETEQKLKIYLGELDIINMVIDDYINQYSTQDRSKIELSFSLKYNIYDGMKIESADVSVQNFYKNFCVKNKKDVKTLKLDVKPLKFIEIINFKKLIYIIKNIVK